MVSTILSVLSRKLPKPKPLSIGPGQNTVNRNWLEVLDWQPWKEFTLNKLQSIYRDVLEAPWKDAPDEPRCSELDLTFGDENGFEMQVLQKAVIDIVNQALRQASVVYGKRGQLNIGRWGRCGYESDSRLHPDWALVNELEFDGAKFIAILPGDSKVAARWTLAMYGVDGEQWALPISQVLTYANYVQCRYGFLITDDELVVLRFTREPVGPGIATTRQLRTGGTQSHQRVTSDVSQLSESIKALSLSFGSSGGQSYVESGRGFEYLSPEYQVIPWGNHGSRLTVRLGLFCLCLMAGYGSSDVRTRYPKLNTWWRQTTGAYRHNTSGLTKRKLGPRDKVEDPDAEEANADGEEDGEQGSLYDELDEQAAGAFPAVSPHEEPDGEAPPPAEDSKGKRRAEGRNDQVRNTKAKTSHIPNLDPGSTRMFLVKIYEEGGKYFFGDDTAPPEEVDTSAWYQANYEGYSVMVFETGSVIYWIYERDCPW